MKPAPFKYFAPTTLDEALALMQEYGDEAKILAGGQSLIPTMNFRLAQPAVLVDINEIPELFSIGRTDGGILIKAMTRLTGVEKSDLVQEHLPLITQAMPDIAHTQIRNRGTFGGSLAHADPAAELPAIAIARKTRFRVQNAAGERWVDADDFYTGLFATALEPEDILTEVEIPLLPEGSVTGFAEVARRHGDYAIVGCCASVDVAPDGVVSEARVVYFGIGEGPVHATQASDLLKGETLTEQAISEAAHVAAQRDCEPPSDIHASSTYRRHLAHILFEDVMQSAAQKTQTFA